MAVESQRATALRIEIECQIGDKLREVKFDKGGRPSETRLEDKRVLPTHAEFGISRWNPLSLANDGGRARRAARRAGDGSMVESIAAQRLLAFADSALA